MLPRHATDASLRLAALLLAITISCPAAEGRAQDPEAQRAAAATTLPRGEAAWLRYPAISPDGRTLVFTYRGDLWRVPASGGDAVRLTSHPAHDYRPVWSPDGSRIAFASDRHGAFQIHVMPATGGAPLRLTHHSADARPYAFSRDGGHVIFGAARLDAPRNRHFPSGALGEIYRVPVDGGRVTQLLTLPAEEAALSGDGRTLVYQDRKGGEDEWRKYHTSAITRDLWVWDRDADVHRRLTDDPAEDRDPVLVPGGREVFYLSESSGSYNVHRIPLSGGPSEPVTRFRGPPVRFLSAADDGTLAFGHDGLLYTLAPGTAEPRRVSVRITTDRHANDERVIEVSGGLGTVAVSPTGKEVAFVSRGEVFATSVETGTTKRLTRTPERETDVQFTPDSARVIYASERGGRWGIYEARRAREEERVFFTSTLLEERPLVVNERRNTDPLLSPDGSRLAFIEDRHTLRVMDMASEDVVTLLTEEHIFNGGQFRWSPDGRWILFTWAVPGRAPRDIGVVRTDGSGEIHNLTRSGFQDSDPQWILGGRAMAWKSNRDGLRSLRATGSTEADVYAMFFTEEAWDEFRLTEEELRLLRERRGTPDAAPDSAAGADDDGPALDLDFTNARERRVRLTIHSSSLGDFLVSEDGETLHYLARFERGLNLWSTELRARETRQVLALDANAASMTWGPRHERIFLVSNGGASVVDPSGWERDPIPIDGEMVVSAEAERAAMFDQMWRHVREAFYTRTFHGTDWDAVRGMYARFLPHIGNHHEFAELLGEALGELNVSHSGARYAPSSDSDDRTASLGAYYDQRPEAAGREGVTILEVMEGGPLDRAGLDVSPGTVILAVDGEPLAPDRNFARLLNRKAERNVLLELLAPDGSVREVVVEPVSLSDESELRYQRWVERNRREVDERSGGRLGYVHIRGMNDTAYRATFEEALGRHFDKEGLVVDTRFNPGGDLVADLEMFFSGRHFFEYTTDTRSSGYEPSFRWTRPSVLLAGEGNYSDGHCFTWAYKEMGIGPVIGMPVPGTCTFGGGQALLDGLRFGAPSRGVKDAVSGRFLENWQTEPDIRVPLAPAEVERGRDAQLERAVSELLARVDG